MSESPSFTPLALHLTTERLVLTPQTDDDAPWMTELLTARDDGRTWTTVRAAGPWVRVGAG